jgi:hypothetical protein
LKQDKTKATKQTDCQGFHCWSFKSSAGEQRQVVRRLYLLRAITDGRKQPQLKPTGKSDKRKIPSRIQPYVSQNFPNRVQAMPRVKKTDWCDRINKDMGGTKEYIYAV